jgi:ribosomal-protein-alanine N-acetyltransferase
VKPFLSSERLAFREMVQSDLDFLYSILADPEVMRFYPHTFDRAGAQDWLDRAMARQARDGHSFWLVSDKFSGEPIGQVGLLKQEVDGAVEDEIGYMLARSEWKTATREKPR